jgi:hypothetical protein
LLNPVDVPDLVYPEEEEEEEGLSSFFLSLSFMGSSSMGFSRLRQKLRESKDLFSEIASVIFRFNF